MSQQTGWKARLALALAAVLIVPSFILIVPGQAQAETSRALTINNANTDSKKDFKGFDGNPVKVFDINGDGDKEIIAQNDNQYVYVFDSESGELLAELKTRIPQGWGARSFNGPEVAVMERGGQVHIVLANSAAVVTSYRYDPGASSGNSYGFVEEWDRRLNDCHSNPGMDAKPVLADLDADGSFEILAGTEERGLYALNDDGSTFWKNCLGGGNAAPAVGDLDRDGDLDVVHASDAGIVAALDGQSGNWLWSFNARERYNLGSGSIPVKPAVTQLDGKGGPDIVVGARDSHNPDDWSKNHALLLALDNWGNVLWADQHQKANPLTYTRPIVVDADADGTKEVYWADWNTNGHKPPWNSDDAWKRLGPANIYRYSAAGELVWRTTLDTWWSNKDLAIADVDGDGTQEVLANGPNGGHDGIWYLDVNTGAKETFVDLSPYKAQRGPVVEDLWGTGTMQWVLEVAPNSAGAGGHGILVYDTGQPFDAAWPHLPYRSFDRGGSDGSSGSGDSFQATFTINNPNEWWQEVYVDPDTPRTIANVEVRIDGSAWKAMNERPDWGAWTSSYHTPKGSQVEFLATDANGATSKSQPFTWLSGDHQKRSESTSSGYDPGFTVSDNVNEWWVEVYVDSNDPVRGVDAQVNDRGWTALERKDWGSWAKSIHAPEGSEVTFRATNTDGDQATSQTYIWMSDSSGSFQATFDPRAQGNDWWVETAVDANEPLQGVDAKVNDGSWTALDRTDWGTWAKSIHAPDGSDVQFRATSSGGDTVTSQTYTWD